MDVWEETMFTLHLLPRLKHVKVRSFMLSTRYDDVKCGWSSLTVGCVPELRSHGVLTWLADLPLDSLQQPITIQNASFVIDSNYRNNLDSIERCRLRVDRCGGIRCGGALQLQLACGMEDSLDADWSCEPVADVVASLLKRMEPSVTRLEVTTQQGSIVGSHVLHSIASHLGSCLQTLDLTSSVLDTRGDSERCGDVVHELRTMPRLCTLMLGEGVLLEEVVALATALTGQPQLELQWARECEEVEEVWLRPLRGCEGMLRDVHPQEVFAVTRTQAYISIRWCSTTSQPGPSNRPSQ